ncbi:hypothetical protein G7Z17_g9644 [Cylindrodendrum hubeiense]|uniref:Uncharacterized protein n=1 Tax=Cylindrodendrum hubeiense TaxID=595255 RepID=A0A9P5H2Y1_9HYPO|nr:hypothetical protein G7Z17_g9644 [Cylindrodendrum hubeiense]
MPSIIPFVLLSLGSFQLAAGQIVNCNSLGIPNGFQGHDQWRASTKDCAEATNKLEAQFGEVVPEASNGCVSLATSGDCEISMCDSTDVRRAIYYESVWTAARIVHARHKADGNVAGYVSLDDYSDTGGFKTFVKVARKDTPNPQGKRKRGLLGRQSALILDEREETKDVEVRNWSGKDSEYPDLDKRANNNWWSKDTRNIPNTGLYANIRAAWGPGETIATEQLENGMENLLIDWNNAQGDPSSLRPSAYMAPGEMLIEFEWAAHNNHNVNDVTPDERVELLHWAVQERQTYGGQENFSMQIRRGQESLGHLIIRVFWAGLNDALADVCG